MKNKREEFIERMSEGLKRFVIRDRMNQFDSPLSRLRIAEYAYKVLSDIVEESKKEAEELLKPDPNAPPQLTMGPDEGPKNDESNQTNNN